MRFKLALDLGKRVADSFMQVVSLLFRSEGFFRKLQSDRGLIERADRIHFGEQPQKNNIGRKAFGFFLHSRDQFTDQFLNLSLRGKALEFDIVFHSFVDESQQPT